MSFHYEIRLSGDIGHGLIMAGKILAEAAAIYDGYNAVQSQSYGEESRGEANRSDIILSDQEILYPKVDRPDILLCFNQTAYDKYFTDLKPDGILITDSNHVLEFSKTHQNHFEFPIRQISRQNFKNESQISVISIGIVATFVEKISPRAVKLALFARIPKGTEDLNEKCLKLGYDLAREEQQKYLV